MSAIDSVYGIGPKKVLELNNTYRIFNVRSLRKHVKKIPDIVNRRQRDSLKYHDKISNKVSRAVALKHVQFIKKIAPGAIIVGSIRRNEKLIGDINVIVTNGLSRAVEKLKKSNYVIVIFSESDDRFSAIGKMPGTNSYRRISMIQVSKKEKPFAMLYYTGDKNHNLKMKLAARRSGYKLTQYDLRYMKSGSLVRNINSEKDIFKVLDMPYTEPQDRVSK